MASGAGLLARARQHIGERYAENLCSARMCAQKVAARIYLYPGRLEMAFAGFDRSDYPGDTIMQRLIHTTNLRWCGYYLAPVPSHPGTSWMGKRAFLTNLGWGIAPLYVGEQVVPPGSQHPSAPKGTTDGNDAVSLMTSEGFHPGSCVYLDLENGPPLPQRLREYVNNWCRTVGGGGFLPGVYCSHLLAAQIQTLQPTARIWAVRVSTTDPHPVPGPQYPDPDPATSGFAGAFIIQLHQNCQTQVQGVAKPLTVDLDSARTNNPAA